MDLMRETWVEKSDGKSIKTILKGEKTKEMTIIQAKIIEMKT